MKNSFHPTVASATLDKVARSLIFATLLVPLVVVPGFFFPFVTVRAVFFRVLVQLASAVLLYSVVRHDVKVSVRRDFVFWALTAWLGVNLVAAAFGVAPIRSLFGDHERMGGVWFWVHLVAYYVLLRTYLRSSDWWRLFQVALAVAAVIAAYGMAKIFLPSIALPIGGLRDGVTIGNNGLLAIYLLANIALCALLALRGGRLARVAYAAVGLLLLVAIVVTGNRSSTLAFLVGAGVATLLHAIWSGGLRGWRAVLIAALFGIAVSLPFAVGASWAGPITSRVPALSRLSSGVDSSRVIQWRAAVDGIRARPLLGVGPENYAVIWSQYHHPEMYRFIADSPWDRAHNAYLDAFTGAGILGFLSLLAIWVALCWTAFSAARRVPEGDGAEDSRRSKGAVEAVTLGFFAAYAFYLFFWFFDLTSTMLWIALAAFVASRAAARPLITIGARREKRWQSTLIVGFGAVVLVSMLYVHAYETLRMARTLIQTRAPGRSLHQTLADFESVFASPAPVTEHAFLMYAGHLRLLQPKFPEIRRDPVRAEVFDRAFVLAIKEFERQRIQDPLNDRVLVQHARVLMLGAYYYRNQRLYESALSKLHRAVEIAPRRVRTQLVLGTAYLNAGDPAKALEIFQGAYAIYPPLGQTHSSLASAHAEMGNADLAVQWLRSAMAQRHTPEFSLVRRVARALADSGAQSDAAALAWEHLQASSGPLFLLMSGHRPPEFEGYAVAARLAEEHLGAAGDSTRLALVRGASRAMCEQEMPLPLLAGAPSRLGRVAFRPECSIGPSPRTA